MKCFLIILFFGSFFSALAQEKPGIANSNYSSTNSIFLNPSSSVDSRTFIQLNLIGANAYLMTNQAYLPAFSVWQVKRGYTQVPHIVTNKMKKFFYGNFSVDAPALVVSHQRIGFGFFIRARAEVDIRRIPYELTRILVPQKLDTALPAAIDINLRNVKLSSMAWAEYGINFGMMVHKRNNVLITAGGNAKYLTGIDIFYANLQRFKAHIDTTVVDIEKLKGKVRVSEPGWNTGKGLGIDAGIIYKRSLKKETEYEAYHANSKKSGCVYIDYRYKIGLSLLDLGYIRFPKKTYKAGIDGSLYIDDFQQVKSLDSLIQNGFKTTLEYDKPILATLPTALSAQVDINLSHHFYLNGTIIKSIIPAYLVGVQRANLLSITPRYERRQVEVALPLTFHRFIYPQLGFAFRVRSFVLGMDNVFPLIIRKNTYGLNLYFNLGISLFKNPACRTKHSRKKKQKIKKRATAENSFMMPDKTNEAVKLECPEFG
ncbi:MAG: hypothetical protein EPN85_06560, partial [Bacteroidetes bacterium]